MKAYVVNLDLSMAGLNLEELSEVEISKMRKSGKTRAQILKILPNLRKTATNILRSYEMPIFAIKQSIPVRIAELTSGANAIRYATEKAINEKVKVPLGLPTRCQSKFLEDKRVVVCDSNRK